MGLMDAFNPEDRIEIKVSEFYKLMKEATKSETMFDILNAETNITKSASILKKLNDYYRKGETNEL